MLYPRPARPRRVNSDLTLATRFASRSHSDAPTPPRSAVAVSSTNMKSRFSAPATSAPRSSIVLLCCITSLAIGLSACSTDTGDGTPASSETTVTTETSESTESTKVETTEAEGDATATTEAETTTTTEAPPVSYLAAETGGSGEAAAILATEADTLVEVTVADGEITVGERRVVVDNGSTVGVVVTSDVADELHVHGFDILATLVPGETVEFSFLADEPGVWEVELEQTHRFVFDVQVEK